jgi:hypothetical protein
MGTLRLALIEAEPATRLPMTAAAELIEARRRSLGCRPT